MEPFTPNIGEEAHWLGSNEKKTTLNNAHFPPLSARSKPPPPPPEQKSYMQMMPPHFLNRNGPSHQGVSPEPVDSMKHYPPSHPQNQSQPPHPNSSQGYPMRSHSVPLFHDDNPAQTQQILMNQQHLANQSYQGNNTTHTIPATSPYLHTILSVPRSGFVPGQPRGPSKGYVPRNPPIPSSNTSPKSFFLNENLRQELSKRTMHLSEQPNTDDPRIKELPHIFHGTFHSLLILDNVFKPPKVTTNVSPFFDSPSQMYRGVSMRDGKCYALRRVESHAQVNKYHLQCLSLWKHLNHPNIVSLHEVFSSKEIADVKSLFFVQDFHPGCVSLEQQYLLQQSQHIPESVLWSYICQLYSALAAIHIQGMACRSIAPSKVLLTSFNRLRISAAGLLDILTYEAPRNCSRHQHEDFIALGKLILVLACRNPNALNDVPASIEHIATAYSKELKNLLIILLSKPVTFEDVMSIISGHLLDESKHLNSYTDFLENELQKEYDNGRLFLLLVKLGFINERPEFALDPSWSETGDRYLLKLFRDYCFHQIDKDNNPLLDYTHVVECLNKLDFGSEEKIFLMSRDDQSLLIVSYKDLKRCSQQCLNELKSIKRAPE